MQMATITHRARTARIATILGIMAGTLSVSVPARANIFKPSVADQKKLGAQAAQQVESKYRLVGGSKQARVQRVGSRLISALGGKDRQWNYRFRVIDSKDVNAFALPGGPVYVFTGLLDRLGNDSELAGVLAHEITHVRKEHWANMAAESQKRNLGLSALLGITRAGRGWYNVAGVASSLVDLRYSRKDEDQADEGGLNNMAAAGYNPRGMLELFNVLQKAGGGGGTPTFLRDHPLTSDRIRKTQQRIAAMGR